MQQNHRIGSTRDRNQNFLARSKQPLLPDGSCYALKEVVAHLEMVRVFEFVRSDFLEFKPFAFIAPSEG
jgi:hypothetical protein